jgi:hypothetical protein
LDELKETGETVMDEKNRDSKDESVQNKSDDERLKEITEAGDIGDEQAPAGEIKTDKCAWNYAADKIVQHDLPKKIKSFLAGL